jgi:hypothetical protein
MAGRFFLPPFVVAAAILVRALAARSARFAWVAAAVIAVVAATRGVPTWLRAPSSEVGITEEEFTRQHGIADERRAYIVPMGLFSPGRAIPVPGALEGAVFPEGRRERWITLCGQVGIAGYVSGPRAHLVDSLLCDPLLARLPVRTPTAWRIGHILRRVPEGYWESLRSGENRILHPGLHEYYGLLRRAMCAPLLDRERLAAVAALALGRADDGFRAFVAEHYYSPPRVAIDASAVAELLPPGVHWFDQPREHVVYEGGVAVRWPEPRSERRVRVQVAGYADFRFRFLRQGEVIADSVVRQPPLSGVILEQITLRDCWLDVPGAEPFDTLWIDFVENALSHTAATPHSLGGVLPQR